MYVVFLAGGIASGKSTVAREMESLGAWRCDLDQVSRSVLAPGMPCVEEVAEAFGNDLVNPETGELNRGLLAKRAFASQEDAARLEAIELPYIREALVTALSDDCCAAMMPVVAVVEIPLLDRMGEMLDCADEIVCVTCPIEERKLRAIARGMSEDDFWRRVANQPSDEWLASHSDTVFDNSGSASDLIDLVHDWWGVREESGWSRGQ